MLKQRKRIWIDQFQTSLIARVFLYCVVFQFAVWTLAYFCRQLGSVVETVIGAGAITFVYVLAIVGVLTLTASAMYDALKLSHRIVGPVVRFRRTIQAIAAGEEIELIQLRRGDFLEGLRDDFNQMLRSLEQRGAIRLKDPRVRIASPSSAVIESALTAGA